MTRASAARRRVLHIDFVLASLFLGADESHARRLAATR
jgi:hypothetical protein